MAEGEVIMQSCELLCSSDESISDPGRKFRGLSPRLQADGNFHNVAKSPMFEFLGTPLIANFKVRVLQVFAFRERGELARLLAAEIKCATRKFVYERATNKIES